MNDLEFVQRCTKGDKHSWDQFVEKYSRLIYTYIHSVLKLKGRNNLVPDTANELFHEIFVLLSKDDFKKLKTFKAKNGCSLASWLRQVTIHYTIDYLRRLKPVVSLDGEDEEGFSLKEVIPDAAASARDTLVDKEKMRDLADCIGKLDTEDKYFLELHMNQELSLEELRRVFRVSRGAIDMRKSRIVERLKDCFKVKGYALD